MRGIHNDKFIPGRQSSARSSCCGEEYSGLESGISASVYANEIKAFYIELYNR